METVGHLKVANALPRKIALAAAFAWLCLFAVPAQALVVSVDIGWGYFGNSDMTEADLIANYALQEGSIVQIIMYDSSVSSAPGPNANDNFTLIGTHTGAAVPGDPNVAPWNEAPTEANVYDPESVPAGHLIAYTTTIGPAVGGNANGYDWYSIYAQFSILDNYDSIYIRVFGATDFPHDGVVHASYWGISELGGGEPVLEYWIVNFDDVTATEHVNYFEVIPEPGSLGLFALGGIGLWAVRWRRPKRG